MIVPTFCCKAMAAQVESSCDQHPDSRNCPDKLVDYLPWVEALDELGLEPEDELPPKLTDDRWWREAAPRGDEDRGPTRRLKL